MDYLYINFATKGNKGIKEETMGNYKTLNKVLIFLLSLNLIQCSNFSFHPFAISGEDTFNRVQLAFSEINSVNPGIYAFATLGSSSETIDSVAVKGLIGANISAKNWAKNVVNRQKWYREQDVDNCVVAIRRTGLLMNLITSNTPSSSALNSLISFSLIPQVSANACNLKPLPDLYVFRTGTEGKAEGAE